MVAWVQAVHVLQGEGGQRSKFMQLQIQRSEFKQCKNQRSKFKQCKIQRSMVSIIHAGYTMKAGVHAT